MSADREATERARLQGYIEGSKRTQRHLGVGLGVALVPVAVALVLWSTVGKLALLGLVTVGICGFWVTAAHISDWRMQISRLDSRARGRAVSRKAASAPPPVQEDL